MKKASFKFAFMKNAYQFDIPYKYLTMNVVALYYVVNLQTLCGWPSTYIRYLVHKQESSKNHITIRINSNKIRLQIKKTLLISKSDNHTKSSQNQELNIAYNNNNFS